LRLRVIAHRYLGGFFHQQRLPGPSAAIGPARLRQQRLGLGDRGVFGGQHNELCPDRNTNGGRVASLASDVWWPTAASVHSFSPCSSAILGH
jgi:hypothetical protein